MSDGSRAAASTLPGLRHIGYYPQGSIGLTRTLRQVTVRDSLDLNESVPGGTHLWLAGTRTRSVSCQGGVGGRTLSELVDL